MISSSLNKGIGGMGSESAVKAKGKGSKKNALYSFKEE